ncbi:MAG: OmpA family protein [Nitrospira sp.]|nr:OmpA family protein [Nitrospira sp.]
MRHAGYVGTVGTVIIAMLFASGCASQSGSGKGANRAGRAERIAQQPIKEVDRSLVAKASQGDVAGEGASGLSRESLQDILFDFDRDVLRPDALTALDLNAKRLRQDHVAHVVLEGRGDEVGTSAYNLVLGERRARSVKNYLQELGLAVDLKTTSYGKDRPLCVEHTSECMQRNRSVRFVVKD